MLTPLYLVYLVIQLGLSQNNGQVYFEDHTCGEVMSAVPYISGFIFCFPLFFMAESLLIFSLLYSYDAMLIFFDYNFSLYIYILYYSNIHA